MITKIITYISYLGTLLNLFADKKDSVVYIVTFDEMKKMEGEQIRVKEIFYRDELITVQAGASVNSGTRTNVMKIPYFVVTKNSKQVILGLKKDLHIGRKNFKEYNRVCDKNTELLNDVINYQEQITSFKESSLELDSTLSYLRSCIGESIYLNYLAKRGTNANH